MTLIEFFDKCPLENIIGSLALRPGRVIFLGSNRPKMEAALTAIRKICREQELHAIISYRMVAKNDITGVLTVLRDILSQDNALSREEEYVFDCSGGLMKRLLWRSDWRSGSPIRVYSVSNARPGAVCCTKSRRTHPARSCGSPTTERTRST